MEPSSVLGLFPAVLANVRAGETGYKLSFAKVVPFPYFYIFVSKSWGRLSFKNKVK